MAQLISQSATSTTAPADLSAAKRRVNSAWLKCFLLLAVLLLVADGAISLTLRDSHVRANLTAKLAAAFGRPVEVSGYEFSLLDGAAIEANSLTVGEDLRFGNEYFLRADSVQANLVWTSLLRGRIELGSLALTRPSLNLVEDTGGDWNISEWLPKPSNDNSTQPSRAGDYLPLAAPRASLRRVSVKNGRINFKHGDQKLPYAFVDVTGSMETDAPGTWRVDLEAAPWRAALNLQQAGLLHVAGHVGGTSSRLRPANLALSWTDASVSDFLRLVHGDDMGVRGGFTLALNAGTAGHVWNLQARAEARQLHRWDIAIRPDNPAANIIADAQWDPGASTLIFSNAKIEAPHSNAAAAGGIQWATPPKRNGTRIVTPEPPRIQITSSAIGLSDVLAWLRSFRPGVSGALNIVGTGHAQLVFSGWPPRLETGTAGWGQVKIFGNGLLVPVQMGSSEFRYEKQSVALAAPLTIFFGDDSNFLRLEDAGASKTRTSAKPQPASSSVRLTAKVAQVRDVIATAAMFGWNLSRGWDVAGPMHADVRARGPFFAPSEPDGFIEWGTSAPAASDALLRAPFLNHPVTQVSARLDWKPGLAQIKINSAQAFGAHWTGTVSRRALAKNWEFALAADKLSAANLDASLNPRWRESFLNRMLPFLNTRAEQALVPEGLAATGRITADQFVLGSTVLRNLQGTLAIGGRHVTLTDASSQLGGGIVMGSLDARLQIVPMYAVDVNVRNVDAASFAPPLGSSTGIFSGAISGTATFQTRGAIRADLLSSLQCEGKGTTPNLTLRGFNLAASLHAVAIQNGTSSVRDAAGSFTCSNGEIHFQDLRFSQADTQLTATGTVGFDRTLNIRLNGTTSDDIAGPASGEQEHSARGIYQLTGSLSSPQIVRIEPVAPRRPR